MRIADRDAFVEWARGRGASRELSAKEHAFPVAVTMAGEVTHVRNKVACGRMFRGAFFDDVRSDRCASCASRLTKKRGA